MADAGVGSPPAKSKAKGQSAAAADASSPAASDIRAGTVHWPWALMLLLVRDYATFDYAQFAILERDYATHYASIIRYATKSPNYFLGGLC